MTSANKKNPSRLLCPNCKSNELGVVDTRKTWDRVTREKHCRNCGQINFCVEVFTGSDFRIRPTDIDAPAPAQSAMDLELIEKAKKYDDLVALLEHELGFAEVVDHQQV